MIISFITVSFMLRHVNINVVLYRLSVYRVQNFSTLFYKLVSSILSTWLFLKYTGKIDKFTRSSSGKMAGLSRGLLQVNDYF